MNVSQILKPDETLWECGMNTYDQTGIEDSSVLLLLRQTMSNVKDVSIG